MERFTNILVAASPGHLEASVLHRAVRLAEANRARLTVLDVVEPLPRRRRFATVGRRTVDVHAELSRHRSEQLHHLVEDARAGDRTEVDVAEGEPFIEVIRHVLEHDHDLVIVGSRAVEQAAPEFPSDVMQVLRKCPVPVWVMRPPPAGGLRILALIDPDPDDAVRDGLNDLVLSLATSLTHREDGELHVGHAWELAGEATLRTSPHVGLPAELVDGMSETAEGMHRAQLAAMLERHHVAETGAVVHLVHGHAGEVLPKLAERLEVGLIVMGTVARTGISGLIIGNTAETILQSVHCSVLAVKPEGFVTPVKP